MNKQRMSVKSTQANKREDIEAIYPLTSLQLVMLFDSFLDPKSGLFMQIECNLQGKLDVTAFEQAWQRAVDRHVILRTGFFLDRFQQPVQIVSRQVSLPLDQQDWRAFLSEEQRHLWEAFLAEDLARGYDVTAAPLMRLALVRIAEQEYRFLLSFHHVVLDGWSVTLLLREVFTLYEALREGRDLYLEPPRPYRDYVAWLQRQDLAKAEAYWQAQLAGLANPTLLSADRGLGGLSADAKKRKYHNLNLPASTARALRALAQQQRLTLNTLFQGAWALLLSHYTGMHDVAFGIAVSGRPAELIGAEAIVGNFASIVPLRVKLGPDTLLLDWLQGLQAENLSIRQYGYAPPRTAPGGRHLLLNQGKPLYSLLNFGNFPHVDSDLGEQREGGLKICSVQQYCQTQSVSEEIALTVWEQADTVEGYFDYNTDLFDELAIMRIAENFNTLLAGMAACPEARLMDLPTLDKVDSGRGLIAEASEATPVSGVKTGNRGVDADKIAPISREAYRGILTPGRDLLISSETREKLDAAK